MLRPNRQLVKNRKVEAEKELLPKDRGDNFAPRRKPNAFEMAYAAHDGKIEIEKLTPAAKKIYEQFSKEDLKPYQPKPNHRFDFNPLVTEKSNNKLLKPAYRFKGSP